MVAAAQPQPKKWSELPEDLIVMIGERLSLYADYVRFQSTCASWYSALAKSLRHPRSRQHQYFPFLFLPCAEDEDNSDSCSDGLLSLPENGKIYHLRSLPKESTSLYCLGSTQGWLVMADNKAPSSMYLFNPFTMVQLPLPPMSKCHHLLQYQPYRVGNVYSIRRNRLDEAYFSPVCVKKVVLSSSPSSSSSVMSSSQFQSSDVVAVAIIYGSWAMAFSSLGDKAWKPLSPGGERFFDVLFYGDHLYAIKGTFKDSNRQILVFQMDVDIGGGGPVPKLVDTLQLPKSSNIFWDPYLVESCGDLLLVGRLIGGTPMQNSHLLLGKTLGFKVLKLCQGNSDDNRSSTWVQINNLGDRMLFLGLNSSLSLSSHDFSGCRGNCIYFTHQNSGDICAKQREVYNMNVFDMGVFNLEDEHLEPLPLQDCTSSRGRHLLRRLSSPPVWLMPSPN